MTKEIQQLECLSQISTAIIDSPTLSIASFGIEKEIKTNQLIYTGIVDARVRADYEHIATKTIALAGAGVLVTSTILSSIGLVAGATIAGTLVTAGGVSATGIGLTVAPFILLWGYKKYKEKKRDQEEKDRMYKELISKQQAAIHRQKQINHELEEKLREQKSSTEQLKKEIDKLKQEINNLMELIEILTDQINQFNQVA